MPEHSRQPRIAMADHQALFAPDKLNLKAFKQRAEKLRSTIDEMCMALQQGNVIAYKDVMDRFMLLNTYFRWGTATSSPTGSCGM